MDEKIDHVAIAVKWQRRWADADIFKVDPNKEPYYVLEMFPYPSGYLHMGHVRNYSLGDVKARYARMLGKSVLYPMGYDSFGLPAENAAIKHGKDPHEWTEQNIAGIKQQQQLMGLSYDWSRELATSHADYYRWNQWLFLQMLEKGLAYKKKGLVNWCPSCNTVLANEQVVNGKCWRHTETAVTEKDLEQWYFKITQYADELLKDIEKLEHWPDRVKTMQRNWIGRKEWIDIDYEIEGTGKSVTVSTTRPETNFGATFVVISPEHPLLATDIIPATTRKTVDEYIIAAKAKTSEERVAEGGKKTGVFTGLHCVNKLTGNRMPLWVADFILMNVGTGVVVGVPGHDLRDFFFAKEFKLPIVRVVTGKDGDISPITRKEQVQEESGTMINSGFLNDLDIEQAIKKMMVHLEAKGWGRRCIRYHLRDWLISRQRYWGTPIPVVYCDACGIVPAKELPVLLPEGADFKAGGNPLATVKNFVETTCPKCGNPARRETDTMDTFVDSSWYFLRFCDPQNVKEPFSKEVANRFMPVDQYIGGIEHAVLHLLYARFITKVLRDLGRVSVDEPFARLLTLGMVTKDGAKMSKSLGNTVDPGEIIRKYGPDTARVFMLFSSHPEKELDWSDTGVQASHRFLNKVASLSSIEGKGGKHDRYVKSKTHSAIRACTQEMEMFRLNAALQQVMELANVLHRHRDDTNKEVFAAGYMALITMLAPFAPHLCEELWERAGKKSFVSLAAWPTCDEGAIDQTAEWAMEAAEQLKADIRKVLVLASISKPGGVTLFLPSPWKYSFVTRMKALLEETSDAKAIIGKLMATPLKAQGQQVMKLVPAILKDRGKLPLHTLSQDEEKQLYSSIIDELSAAFGCPVAVQSEDGNQEQKARQAMPGKPAILIR